MHRRNRIGRAASATAIDLTTAARLVPIQFTPSTQRQYSGEGFRYLQSVIQEVTRQPFVELMRVNVLEPFGMTSSRFVWDDELFARRVARGHHDERGQLPALP